MVIVDHDKWRFEPWVSTRKLEQHIFYLINSQSIINSRHFDKSSFYSFLKWEAFFLINSYSWNKLKCEWWLKFELPIIGPLPIIETFILFNFHLCDFRSFGLDIFTQEWFNFNNELWKDIIKIMTYQAEILYKCETE